MDMKSFQDKSFLSLILVLSLMNQPATLWAGTTANQTTSTSAAGITSTKSMVAPTTSAAQTASPSTSQNKPPIAASGVPQGAVTQAAQTKSAPAKAASKSPVYKTPDAALSAYLEKKKLRLTAVYEKMEVGEAVNAPISMTVGVKAVPGDGRTTEEFFVYQIVKQNDTYKVVSARRASDKLAFRISVFNEAKRTNQNLQSLSQVSVTFGPLRDGVRKSKAKIKDVDYTFDARKTDAKPAQYIAENLKAVQKVTKSGNPNSNGNGDSDTGGGDGTQTTGVAKVTGTAVVGGMFPGITKYSFIVSGASQDHPVKVTVKTRQPGSSAFNSEIVTVTQEGARLNFSEPARSGFGEGEAKGEIIFIFAQDGKEIKPEIQFYYAP